MKPEEQIYESCEAANDALGPCIRPLSESDGGHWWYTDHELINEMEDSGRDSYELGYLPCVCKSCPQTMRLSFDAEEFPI